MAPPTGPPRQLRSELTRSSNILSEIFILLSEHDDSLSGAGAPAPCFPDGPSWLGPGITRLSLVNTDLILASHWSD